MNPFLSSNLKVLFTKNKLNKIEVFKILLMDNTIFTKSGQMKGNYIHYEKTYPPIKKESSQQVAKRNFDKKIKDKLNSGYKEVINDIYYYSNISDFNGDSEVDVFFNDRIVDNQIIVTMENSYHFEDYLLKYFEDYKPTDLNGLIKPMKAVPYYNAKGESIANKTTVYIAQRKYNGLRSLLSLTADKSIKLTSFEGHFYKLTHILNGLKEKHFLIDEVDTLKVVEKADCTEYHSCLNNKLVVWKDKNHSLEEVNKMLQETFKAKIPLIFDGEIYQHGKPLNQILSASTNYNMFSQDLEYIIYDLAIDDLTQTARLNLLSKWYKLYKEEISDKIKLAPISLAQGLSNIEILKNKYNAEGYEGLILRNPAAYYGFGTRSKDCMIKYKSFIEAEFKVIGHRVTKKIVNGKTYSILIFMCLNDIDSQTFEVTMNGSSDKIEAMLDNISSYYGKELTIKYFERSPFNIPLHAKGKGFKGVDI